MIPTSNPDVQVYLLQMTGFGPGKRLFVGALPVSYYNVRFGGKNLSLLCKVYFLEGVWGEGGGVGRKLVTGAKKKKKKEVDPEAFRILPKY